jgi:hypothetical protein
VFAVPCSSASLGPHHAALNARRPVGEPNQEHADQDRQDDPAKYRAGNAATAVAAGAVSATASTEAAAEPTATPTEPAAAPPPPKPALPPPAAASAVVARRPLGYLGTGGRDERP